MATIDEERAVPVLRRLVAPIYLPIMAGTFGVAMLVPVLPLYLEEVGLSLQVTSIVLAGAGMGATLGGLPAGAAIARLGERSTMFAAIAGVAVTTALVGLTGTAFALIGLRLGTGAASSMLRLSRQTYITRRVSTNLRGRAMSLIGGSYRVSLFVGPLLGGVLVDSVGFDATFVVAGAITALGVIPPSLQPSAQRDIDGRDGECDLEPDVGFDEGIERDDEHRDVRDDGFVAGVEPAALGLFATIRSYRRLLLLVAVVPALTMAVREGRYVVVPLIGDDLGLSPTAVGALVAVGTASDLALFPIAGFVMDRFGRLAAMVPAFSLIAVGLSILGVAETTTMAVVAGAVMGIGNGLSSGALLTLGSDLAPAGSPGPFLAAIAVIQDVGKVLGPLVVGFVGSAASLATASLVLAALMVVVIAWLVFVLGETRGRRTG